MNQRNADDTPEDDATGRSPESAFAFASRYRHYILVGVVLGLFFSNPKPDQVYLVMADAAKETVRAEMSKNAVLGLMTAAVINQITPETIRAVMQVSHLNGYIGSIFVVSPTALGQLGYALGGLDTETVYLCGVATMVFPCPDWVRSMIEE